MPEEKKPVPSVLEMAGTVPVDNLHQFVKILSDWHETQVGKVKHLLTVPLGAAFEIGEGADVKTVVMTEEARNGFILGLEMALMQLGTLPFAAELEDAPPADAPG